jgi:hypothetical protein
MYLIKTSILYVLILLGSACSADQEKIPWMATDFANPVETRFTIKNISDADVFFHLGHARTSQRLNTVVPDTLLAGEQISVSFPMHVPDNLFLVAGDLQQKITLLPGLDRSTLYRPEELYEGGVHREVYQYFLQLERLYPTESTGKEYNVDLDKLIDLKRSQAERAVDSFSTITSPVWLPAVLQAHVDYRHANMVFKYTDYNWFLYKDRVLLPDTMVVWAEHLLAQEKFKYTIDYSELLSSYTRYRRRNDPEPKDSVSVAGTINYDAIAKAYVKSFPVPRYQNDAIALQLEELYYHNSQFSGREEIIQTMRYALPSDYRKVLDSIQAKTGSEEYDHQALKKLFETPLVHPFSGTQTINELSGSSLKLFKFWFAGCHACLLQQPFERKLLKEFYRLDFVTVCYATDQDVWSSYITQHPIQGTHLYVEKINQQLLVSALGGIGAPRYLLVDGSGNIICHDCPKPEDEALVKLIRNSFHQ